MGRRDRSPEESCTDTRGADTCTGVGSRAVADDTILDPDLPIIDAHHHLWLEGGHGGSKAYTVRELQRDASSGHRVVATVFVECRSQYRDDGPLELRPVGETAFVAEQAAQSVQAGGPPVAAIVGFADLTRGDAVEPVLRAHEEAGRGLFRGVRHTTAHDPSPMNNMAPRAAMMGEEAFRDGVRTLGRLGHSFDAFCFHPQLPELTELARACPGTTIVANHIGVPIAGGPYRGRAAETRASWRQAIAELAGCPNVVMKLGGITRPLSGERWDRDPSPARAEDIERAWREEIRHCIEQFGPDRCLFESNFPVDKPCVSYAELWNGFKRITAQDSAEERRAMFHDTAARVYRIER